MLKFIFYDAAGNEIGTMNKILTFIKPKFTFSFDYWIVTGNLGI